MLRPRIGSNAAKSVMTSVWAPIEIALDVTQTLAGTFPTFQVSLFALQGVAKNTISLTTSGKICN